MIFTNNQKKTIEQTALPHTYVSGGAFSARYLRGYVQSSTPLVPQKPLVPPVIARTTSATPSSTTTPKKKMKWGEPTWNLFHTLAEKIKPEYYVEYRAELLSMIKMICNTLPCPICANHATQYMKNIQEHRILTKTDLQHVLWEFHNTVNERKGADIFPLDQLQPRYSNANVRVVIQTFMAYHSDKQSGFRLIADDFYRSKVVKTMKEWFINNNGIFLM